MKTSANVSNEKIMQWSHTPWSKIKTFTKNFLPVHSVNGLRKQKRMAIAKLFPL